MKPEFKWELRFTNYKKAFERLDQGLLYIRQNFPSVESLGEGILPEMIKESIIHRFKDTYEEAWIVMKDYVKYEEKLNVGGAKESVQKAYQLKLIKKREIWLDMIRSQNKIYDAFNPGIADEIYAKIINDYFPSLRDFNQIMREKQSANNYGNEL